MHFDNVFYSYPMDELESFSEISKISKKLSIIPEGVDTSLFYERLKNQSYAAERSAVYQRPDVKPRLLQEAQRALKRKRTAIQKKNQEKNPSDASRMHPKWVVSKGHFNYSGPTRSANLQKQVNILFGEECKPVGDFIYPRGGYRNWHTNRYDTVGWAMFLVQIDEPEKSFFRFVHPNTDELITIWDEPNSVNFFRVQFDPMLWHCIVSEDTNRWSQGFMVPDDWQVRIKIT